MSPSSIGLLAIRQESRRHEQRHGDASTVRQLMDVQKQGACPAMILPLARQPELLALCLLRNGLDRGLVELSQVSMGLGRIPLERAEFDARSR
ncbi:MAG: hypothetical protein ABEL51_02315 [Salinibacter sp.]